MTLDVPDLATDLKDVQLQGGAAALDPAAYGLSPPLFQPLTAYAASGRIFPAPARGTPHPELGHQRAIRPGTHRAATDITEQRTTQLSRPDDPMQYTFQAGHAGSIPVARSRKRAILSIRFDFLFI
jgi:hypothetical protein